MSKQTRSICIFMESGRTFTFRNVLLVLDNESFLSFDYTAASDGRKKTATFQKSRIVGWSWS